MIDISVSIATVKGELCVHVKGRGACANPVEELYYQAIRTALEATIEAVRANLVERNMTSPGSMQTGPGAVVQHEEFRRRAGMPGGEPHGGN